MLHRPFRNISVAHITGIASALTDCGINHFTSGYKHTRFDLIEGASKATDRPIYPLGGLAVFKDWRRPERSIRLSTEVTAIDLADCYGSDAAAITDEVRAFDGTIDGVSVTIDSVNRLVAMRTLTFEDELDRAVDPEQVVEQMRRFGDASAFIAKKFLP